MFQINPEMHDFGILKMQVEIKGFKVNSGFPVNARKAYSSAVLCPESCPPTFLYFSGNSGNFPEKQEKYRSLKTNFPDMKRPYGTGFKRNPENRKVKWNLLF